MTFMQAGIVEFDQVRQHHDTFVELGRLELIAEELRMQGDEAQLSSVERHMQELGSVLMA